MGRVKMEVREEMFAEQAKYNELNNKYLEIQQEIEISKIKEETLTNQLEQMPDPADLEELKHVKAERDILKAKLLSFEQEREMIEGSKKELQEASSISMD